MWFDKIKLMAQIIGFICIGLLAIYGGVVAATGGPPAWAAGAAAPGAITPPYISYQGTLRDASDNLANGTYNMEVAICQNADGSGQIWSETHNNVEVREGHFNLLLGESAALSREDFVDPSLYVELTVDGQVMTPRQRFAAVPYAISATYATKLSAPDGDPSDAVTVNNAGNVHIGASDRSTVVTMQGITPTLRLDHGAGNVEWGIRANGEDFEIQETDYSGYPVRLKIQGGTGRVGIGTTDPQNKLDVNGGASVSGNLGVGTTSPDQKLSVVGTVRGANDAAETEYTEIAHGGSNGYINTVGDGNLDFRHDNDTKMSLNDAGDLDVDGNVDADSLTIDGSKPIFIRKATCTGHDEYCNTWWNNLEVDTWACGIVGVSVEADQDENGGLVNPLFQAIALPTDVDSDDKDEWKFYFDVHDETGQNQNWTFTILCVKRDMADIDGF